MLSSMPLTVRGRVGLVSCVCGTLLVLLLVVPSVVVAQAWDPSGPSGEPLAGMDDCVQPDDSVQPVGFLSAQACSECRRVASCDTCGRCASCCTCGGLLYGWPRLWECGLDVGVNGAAGNSQNLNIVFGFDAKRKSGLNTVTLDCDYLLTQEDAEVTKNRLYTLGRFERDIPDSAWNYFSDGWLECDQFKEYDSKIGMHVGLGVLLGETCKSKLTARFGGGTSKEFGSADDAWKPEGLAGLACERKFTSRQKISASVDYFPNVGDVNSFRVHARVTWELLLDEEMNLSLKASAFDAYDNTPSGSDVPNDIDYSLALHWGF